MNQWVLHFCSRVNTNGDNPNMETNVDDFSNAPAELSQEECHTQELIMPLLSLIDGEIDSLHTTEYQYGRYNSSLATSLMWNH